MQKKKNALIVVDIQNDFMPDGALGVQGADAIISLINRLVVLPFDVCVASKDWHPKNHVSFASTWKKKPEDHLLVHDIDQTLWPDHCIQNTFGAEFYKDLTTTHFEKVMHKGAETDIDSYSTFFDNEKKRSTGLEKYLKEKGVTDLYFAGLTTEYCVLYSVLDALGLGFTTHVAIDACRGIELQVGDVQKAIDTIKASGCEYISVEDVERRLHEQKKS